jgi:hypothetical protein
VTAFAGFFNFILLCPPALLLQIQQPIDVFAFIPMALYGMIRGFNYLNRFQMGSGNGRKKAGSPKSLDISATRLSH